MDWPTFFRCVPCFDYGEAQTCGNFLRDGALKVVFIWFDKAEFLFGLVAEDHELSVRLKITTVGSQWNSSGPLAAYSTVPS